MSSTVIPADSHAAVRADIERAAAVLAPVWPIASFVAVNPLAGLEHLPFEEAGERAERAFGAPCTFGEERFRALHAEGRITDADLRAALLRRLPGLGALAPITVSGRELDPVEVLVRDLVHGPAAPGPQARPSAVERADLARGTRVAARVDEETARWCAAFLDEGQSAWAMPGRERGLYPAWRAIAAHDRGLPRAVRRGIAQLPDTPEAAVLAGLDALGVRAADRVAELERHLARLSGWAAALRRHAEQPPAATGPADLADLLAIQFSLETLLAGAPLPAADVHAGPAGALRDDGLGGMRGALASGERLQVWQEAYEEHLRGRLLARLATPESAPRPAARPRAQAVFCIDVRSEVLRRRLEEQGPYETLGFAGFFGVAMRFRGLGAAGDDPLCPVLLEPAYEVGEHAAPGQERRTARWLRRRRQAAAVAGAAEHLGEDPGAPFAFAEASGWVLGPAALARTLAPGARRRRAAQAPPARIDVDALGRDAQIATAITALRMMGLVRGFGRLVLLCAHGSHTENNPFAAALDCGACGGNAGGPNARALAAILNLPHVRDALRLDGIEVPEDTWFVAGLHDTTADTVTILDRDLVPAGHAADLAALEADLRAAGAATSAERLARLPEAGAPRTPEQAARRAATRGRDWAQVRPEWGLAGCAAFIVGPRAMTAGHDLEGRTFLHSYDPEADRDGSALETILTAPLIVAHWISSAYHFATVAPDVFGSGDKTLHNIVAGLGVLEGPSGDLRCGLPRQAAFDGERPVHEPVRLMAAVQAPLARIDTILAGNPGLNDLVAGGWIALAAREDAGDPWQRRRADGTWEAWHPEPATTATEAAEEPALA